MTTLTTVFALVPMALGWGEGGEVQAPMARVVIGGLATSMLITLVLIPVVYASVKERAVLKRWRWSPHETPRAPTPERMSVSRRT